MTDRTPIRARAFTLTELIVVITIVVIMLAVSIPTFRSTLESTAASAAETKLRLAFVSARDAALDSDAGSDTALVFLYEPGSVTSMVVCTHVGSFVDSSGARLPDNSYPTRDVFVPVTRFDPVQMPAGWMVRALVTPGSVEPQSDWYDGGTYNFEDERSWVFPETGFFDALSSSDGADRQSFIIRFNAVTGSVKVGDTSEVLVLDPRATASERSRLPGYPDYRVDLGTDLAAVVRRALRRDDWRGLSSGMGPLEELFGDVSGDTVLCRPVSELVLYQETDLAAAVSVSVDRATGTIYQDSDAPEYDRRVRSPEQQRRIVRWLEGDTNQDDQWDAPLGEDQPVARIYTLQRYTATLQPVPIRNLEDLARDYGPGGGP